MKVKGKTVVVTKPSGESVSTTEFVSDTTAHSASKEKTEINVRKIAVTGMFSPGNGNGYGGIVTYNFFGSMGLGMGALYTPESTRGLVAVTLQF